ncbi:sugar phosphate isomerase/epimerase [Bacillaceae bacterium SIJ1]|uniref:sugar phosphate isomerase/epimerase family protein n=1 Tax=Litoribacterium kuwaitense TaxID=1398745 RepID=UPI0013EC133D|nr:sugar phosphate isomerase/epimerase family protein [Litoribacterium kuwaitense]NGP45617.1 sugar phosphate isomerase/epimerase [Litoribacterium kuwaitense]
MVFDRLGVITDEVSSHTAEALNWAKEKGLKHVEVRRVNDKNIIDLSDREIKQLLHDIEQRGLFVSCISSPVFKCALNPTRTVATGDTFGQDEEGVEAHFQKLNRAFDIARLLKTDKIRIFSFWREQNPSNYEDEVIGHLKRAAELAAKEDMLLLLENEGACNGGYASEVSSMVKKVNSSHLKALWDPGNEEHGGRSAFPQGYEEVKGLIGHVHLKDAYIQTDGQPRCVPIGDGHVAYLEQLQAIDHDGYRGLFTIETHYVPEDGTKMDGTQLTLDGLKRLFQKAEK